MTFNGARLRIGRLLHGLTQRELADRVAVSHGLIAFYEKGLKEPKGDILEAIASVLEVQPAFFFDPHADEFREEESNFRRNVRASDRLRRSVLARASMFGLLVNHLSKLGEFPAFDFPDLPADSVDDVEEIAERTREHWKLGIDAPIADVTRVAENAGAAILSIDIETAEQIDAFSRYGSTSVIVLNGEKGSASRALFDLAHEIGHGVLHGSPTRNLPLARREVEADRFAGAFLLPRESFSRDFLASYRDGWDGLRDMKRYWRVSLQVIVVRAFQLALIDAAEYRTLYRQLARRGWRTAEPDEPTPERPVLLAKALDLALRDFGKSTSAICDELHWTPATFQKVTGISASKSDVRVIAFARRSADASTAHALGSLRLVREE